MNLRLGRIKIWELQADTIAQSVERLYDRQRSWVPILASVGFFIGSVALFHLCYPAKCWRSNFDRGLQNNNGDMKKNIKIRIKLPYICMLL